MDPSLTTALDTVGIGEVTFKIPWEPLKPGPVGEYLEVMDLDPASKSFYKPVDLDAPVLLAQDGLPPSEGVPQFHQQMAYAVSRLTIENFEQALGRKTLWRPGRQQGKRQGRLFIPQLRIYPHALREANAYYSPDKIALLFGYFNAEDDNPANSCRGKGIHMPFARYRPHETTHASSRRHAPPVHRRRANPDVLAFHEGFADMRCDVAALHFSRDSGCPEIAAARDILANHQNSSDSGCPVRSRHRSCAVRYARPSARGISVWTRKEPEPENIRKRRWNPTIAAQFSSPPFSTPFSPSMSGAPLTCFGSPPAAAGILRQGAIHPDLVGAWPARPARPRSHVLTMCIRAPRLLPAGGHHLR